MKKARDLSSNNLCHRVYSNIKTKQSYAEETPGPMEHKDDL